MVLFDLIDFITPNVHISSGLFQFSVFIFLLISCVLLRKLLRHSDTILRSAQVAAQTTELTDHHNFQKGNRVVLIGLRKHSELNGCRGRLNDDFDGGRLSVELEDGRTYKINAENLILDVSSTESIKGDCAICFEQVSLVQMPCCGRDTSTTQFCFRCIEVICKMAPGFFGKCPHCRKSVTIKGRTVVVTTATGTCRMCQQGGKIIVDQNMCEACLYGSRYILRYECEGCHGIQRIPHPMWRYQHDPAEFGRDTWACHQRCGTFTRWRTVREDLALVPAQDRPASWGSSSWLELVRQVRQLDLQNTPQGGS